MTYHRAITRRRYLSCRHFYTQVDLEDVEAQLLDSRNDVERLEQWLDSNFRHSELQKLVAGLSDNQQKTLRLCFFEGYTLDEIALQLGQSKENVRHHYFRGLDKLRKQILHNQSGR
jgi:RNA polymerase sigma-70 factor (ECF subfamily)